MQLFFDGWYAEKKTAEEVLYGLVPHGAVPIGVVENLWKTYGILYYRSGVLFPNHIISDKDNVIYATFRHMEEMRQLSKKKARGHP